MSIAVTDWFPAEVKPVHPGVYELRGLPYPFHYWSGKNWLNIAERSPSHFQKSDIRKAKPAGEWFYFDRHEWRGLASDPSKAAK